MIAKRIVTVVTALLGITGLGACASPATEARREEPAAIAPAPAAASANRDMPVVARPGAVVRNVPAGFPLPPGSRVTGVSDPESGATFTLSAPDPEAVVSFYRRQLPLGAFTIVADRAEADATSLSFRNAEGWAGAIYATANRVAVAVKRA